MHLIFVVFAAFTVAAAAPHCGDQLKNGSLAWDTVMHLSQPGNVLARIAHLGLRDKVELLTQLGGLFASRDVWGRLTVAAAFDRRCGWRQVTRDVFAAVRTVAKTLSWSERRELVFDLLAGDDDSRITDCDYDGPPTDRLANALVGRDVERLIGQTLPSRAYFGQEHVHLHRDLVFLTMPYVHLRRTFAHFGLKPGTRLVDLGSGEGGVGMVVGLFHPEVDFLGLELVPERVLESARVSAGLGFSRVRFWRHDLSRQTLPEADTYFAFNPTSEDTARIIAADLGEIARRRRIRLLITNNSLWLLRALDRSIFHQVGEEFPALWKPVLQFEN